MKLFKNWKVIWTPRRERGGGMDWEIGIDIYTLIYVEEITNRNLLIAQLIRTY